MSDYFGYTEQEAISYYRNNRMSGFVFPGTGTYHKLKVFRKAHQSRGLSQISDDTYCLFLGGLLDANVERSNNRLTLSTSKIGYECIDFVEKGYIWNLKGRHPSIIYTLGYYLYMATPQPYGSPALVQKFRLSLEQFCERYEKEREEIDVYISQAILISN